MDAHGFSVRIASRKNVDKVPNLQDIPRQWSRLTTVAGQLGGATGRRGLDKEASHAIGNVLPNFARTTNERRVTRRGIMLGIPADTLLAWANVISLSALGIAATGTLVIYQLSARMNAAKVRELQQVQSEARTQIEIARVDADQVSARIAELEKANAELQLELQNEKDARTTMPGQFQPRDVTKEQIAKFVGAIKGKVRQLSLFTVPDPEASVFGIAVLDALRKADVSVTWYRMQSSVTPIQGVASTGVIIYEYPGRGGAESAGRTLLNAFTGIDVQSNLLSPAQPLQGVPSPSLIIALKPPAFLRPSDRPIPSETASRRGLRDLLSRAE